MTAAEFRAWRARLGLTIQGASILLGISPATVCRYQAGTLEVADRTARMCELLERINQEQTKVT